MSRKLVARRRPKVVNSLRHLIASSAELWGDKALYIYKEKKEIKTMTYNDVYNSMNWLGTAFSKIGIMGKHVAVIGDSHPLYMVAYYAIVNGGGVIVPLDKELADDEIVNFMNLSEVSAVVYTEGFNRRLINYAERLPNVEYFIPIAGDTEDTSLSKVKRIDELIRMGRNELGGGNMNFVNHDIDLDKLAAILFTSGTTGTSKGVMLSHRNITANVNASVQSMELDDTNMFVSVLPFHHSYEITCGQFGIAEIGSTMFINDSLKNTLRNFSEYKPTTLIVVPLFVETMHKRIWTEIKKKNKTEAVRLMMGVSDNLLRVGVDLREVFFKDILNAVGGRLLNIVCGGAPLNPQLVRDFRSFGIHILEGYGITECSPLVSVNRVGSERLHSVGQPVAGCQVKIDKKNDEKTGEILVKGESVMMGYYKNEEATKAAFTTDGWFRTGDIGYIDNEGYIFITGRKKNVIILSNGKNVFPEEIEEYLLNEPLILECVVIGRKNDKGDIVITAVIYPDYSILKNQTQDEIYTTVKNVVNTINKRLPSFKQVHEVEIRDAEFEKTTSKKIKRYTVK